MTLLAEVKTSGSGDSPYKNFIVVPGFAGRSLGDRTCPHFDEWLGRVVVKCATSARSWVYNHGIRLEDLESWDKYCTAGNALLEQLLYLQGKLGEVSSPLLCLVETVALTEAWNNEHKDEYRQLLDMIDTIMFVGEPSLHPKKPDEWIENISECAARQRGLPKQLANGATVGCLQNISDIFETILLRSTLFDVTTTARKKSKRRFRLRKMEHDGCICRATVHVRLFTTSSEETSWDPAQGDLNVCSFNPESSHFDKLLTLDSYSEQSQLTEPGIYDLNTGTLTVEAHPVGNAPISLDDTLGQSGTPEDESPSQLPYGMLAGDEEKPESRVIEEVEPQIDKDFRPSPRNGHQPVAKEVGSQPSEESTSEDADVEEIRRVPSVRNIQETASAQYNSAYSSNASHESVPELAPPSPADDTTRVRERKVYLSSRLPPRDDGFYGRKDVLQQLERIVPKPRDGDDPHLSIQSTKANRIWLSGLPGIGKSSVAVEFANRFGEYFGYVIWLNASSNTHLGKYCHDSAVALGLVNGRVCQDHQVSRSRLLDFLNSSSTPWLLILDDHVEGVDISPYLSNNANCSVIATGRQPPPSNEWSAIEIPPFTPVEAAHFIVDHVKNIKNQVVEQEADSICTVAVRYCVSPMAIRLLAEWSVRDAIPLKEIDAILNVSIGALTFNITPAQDIVSCTMDRLDTSTVSILTNLCFYDSNQISGRLLRIARTPRSGRPRRNATDDQGAVLRRATSLLWRSALLDIDDSASESEPSYYMHKSVQDWVRNRVDDETWRDGFETACESISYQWPSKRKLKNIMGGFWEEFDNLHTHVQSLATCLTTDRLVNRLSYDPGDEFKKLLVYHTWYNSRRGNYEEDQNLRNLTEFLLTTKRDRNANKLGRVASPAALPRRCILVDGNDNEPVARLVTTQGSHAPYIALSYAWGTGVSSFRLNRANLRQYEENIDISTTPKQISDAIRFTRNMGVRYLWVDALCVCQDNPTEVSEELDRFVEYYSHSAMVICALQPPPSLSRLQWEPGHRIDIPPYSVIRSGARGDAQAETSWDRVGLLQERCFRVIPSDKRISTSTSTAKDAIATRSEADAVNSEPPNATEPFLSSEAESKSLMNSRVKTSSDIQAGPTDILRRQPSDKAGLQLAQRPETEMCFEDILVAYLAIGIKSFARGVRCLCTALSAYLHCITARGQESPWLVVSISGILLAAISFYAGTCIPITKP